MTSNYIKTVQIPAQQAAQAAAEAQVAALAAQQAQVAYAASPQPTMQASGSCSSWLAQAGIAETADVDYLIQKESGCNPNATNHSSGACGIGQQLPCGKWPHVWNDPVGGLIDMQAYVIGSYGSWGNAAAHERNSGWY